jgi:thymidine phosphorylase
VEIIECLETLKGRGPEDVTQLVVALAARMVVLSGRADERTAEAVVSEALSSGAALESMRALIREHGGNPAVIDDYSKLPQAANRHAIAADADGYVAELYADLIGRASMALGAGRQRIDDRIDHGAGVLIRRKPGEQTHAGETILELLYNDNRGLSAAAAMAREAIRLTPAKPVIRPLIFGRVA